MIYLILFFLLFIISILYDYYGLLKNRTLIYWLLVAILIAVAGIRYHIGLDSIRINGWYESCPNIFQMDSRFFEESSSSFQPLWIILCSLLKIFSPDFALVQFVQSAIANILIFKFIKKKTPYIFSSILIYFLIAYVLFNFEIMRESLAIAISLYAVLYYENKKWIKSLIIFVIAFEIHVSVIIMLIFPLIYKIKYRKSHIIISLIVVTFISILYSKYIDSIYAILNVRTDILSHYILKYSYGGDIGNSFKYYISIYINGFLLPILFLYIRNEFFEDKYKYSSFVILYSIFSLLGNETVAFLRFSNYQLIFYIILIAETYQYAINKLKSPLIIGSIFCLIISFSFLYSMFKPVSYINGAMTYCRYYPYYTIFSKEEDYYRELMSELELY